MGKSAHKNIKKEETNANFDAGYQEEKREIMQFANFSKGSDIFTKLGNKTPEGSFIFGPLQVLNSFILMVIVSWFN